MNYTKVQFSIGGENAVDITSQMSYRNGLRYFIFFHYYYFNNLQPPAVKKVAVKK